MTPKEKKEYTILGILIVAIIVVVYFSFFRGRPEEDLTPPPVTIDTTGTLNPAQLPFLPYGTTFDTKVTEDQRLRLMVPPSYPTVDISEVGLVNPFAP